MTTAAATMPISIGIPTRLAPLLIGANDMVLFAVLPVAVPDGAAAVAFAPKLVGYGGPLGLTEVVVGDGATAGSRLTPTLPHSC